MQKKITFMLMLLFAGCADFGAFAQSTATPLVEDGKVYTIDFVSLDQNTMWAFSTNGETGKVEVATEKGTGSEFVAQSFTDDNGKTRVIFVNNADGYYLTYHNATKKYICNNGANDFTVGNLETFTGQYVTATADQKEGKVYIIADGRSASDATLGCFILKEATAGFDKSNAPYYNGSHTSALYLTEKKDAEVSDKAALSLKKAEVLYKAKPYYGFIGNTLGFYTAQWNNKTYTDFSEFENDVNGADDIVDKEFIITNSFYPEAGKTYKISSYQKDGNLYQIVNGDPMIKTDGTVEDNSGYWICRIDEDGVYYFESAVADGNYFGWQGLSDSPYGFNLEIKITGGYFQLYSSSIVGNDANNGRYLYVHKNASGGTNGWDRYGSPVWDTKGSTCYMFEEVVREFDVNESVTSETIEKYDGQVVDVELRLTLAGGVNAVVLPFDLSVNLVETVFGEGAEVYTYSSDKTNEKDVTVEFNKQEDGFVEANTPVLVKIPVAATEEPEGVMTLAENVAESVTLKGVKIVYSDNPVVNGTSVDFTGVYDTTPVNEGDYVVTAGSFTKNSGSESVMPFHAYFKVKAEVDDVTLKVGDTTVTGIDNVTVTPIAVSVYDLQGRKLAAPVKGVNIVNGRKVLVK